MTIILKIDPSKIDAEKIKIASSIIKNGGLVAFLTSPDEPARKCHFH